MSEVSVISVSFISALGLHPFLFLPLGSYPVLLLVSRQSTVRLPRDNCAHLIQLNKPDKLRSCILYSVGQRQLISYEVNSPKLLMSLAKVTASMPFTGWAAVIVGAPPDRFETEAPVQRLGRIFAPHFEQQARCPAPACAAAAKTGRSSAAARPLRRHAPDRPRTATVLPPRTRGARGRSRSGSPTGGFRRALPAKARSVHGPISSASSTCRRFQASPKPDRTRPASPPSAGRDRRPARSSRATPGQPHRARGHRAGAVSAVSAAAGRSRANARASGRRVSAAAGAAQSDQLPRPGYQRPAQSWPIARRGRPGRSDARSRQRRRRRPLRSAARTIRRARRSSPRRGALAGMLRARHRGDQRQRGIADQFGPPGQAPARGQRPADAHPGESCRGQAPRRCDPRGPGRAARRSSAPAVRHGRARARASRRRPARHRRTARPSRLRSRSRSPGWFMRRWRAVRRCVLKVSKSGARAAIEDRRRIAIAQRRDQVTDFTLGVIGEERRVDGGVVEKPVIGPVSSPSARAARMK
jgi:hypothetical protein